MISPAVAMLGLNLLSTGLKYGAAHKSNKAQKSLAKAQHKANVNQANRALDQTGEDLGRGRHRLLGSLNSRGVFDSSIKDADLAFYDKGSARQMDSARENVALASKGMSNFKKQMKMQKMNQFLDLGLGIANAGLGAWAMGSMAPKAAPDFSGGVGDPLWNHYMAGAPYPAGR
jgi:hypothetical protein